MNRFGMLGFRQNSLKSVLRYVSTVLQQEKTQLDIQEMPRPLSMPFIGTKLNLFLAGGGTKLHEYIDQRHKQLGPIFCEALGGSADLVFVSDPTLIKSVFLNLEGKYPMHILPDPWILYEKIYGSKRGLFFMNGEEWLKNRRTMNKILLREDSENWLEGPIIQTIDKFILKWKKNNTSGNAKLIPDMESDFYRLSIDVIIQILMGNEWGTFNKSKQYDELLSIFTENVKKIFQTTTKLYGLPLNWCERLNLKIWRDFKQSVDTSLFLAQKIISELLPTKNEGNGLIKKLATENVSEDLIARIIGDFIIAAGDTTAYTTVWTLYLLSKNDDLRREIRVGDIKITKNVLRESMRLYPVAPFLTRIIPKESIMGSYKIKEGTPIIASIYTTGRDEQYFSKADQFLPYRWDRNDPRKQNLLNHVPSASLPFALGARSCIGKKIAMLQVTNVIKQIVDNFEFRCTNSSQVKANTSQVLVPDQQVEIVFTPRKESN